MKQHHAIAFIAVLFALFSSCKKDIPVRINREKTRTFFGDNENNVVVVADVDDFKLLGKVSTSHQATYTADLIGNTGKVYVVNRGSNAIDVVDCESLQLTNTIELDHFPRSAESVNEKMGLVAVTGMDKPMVSIIDMKTEEVVAVVGNTEITYPVQLNASGTHACGHPFWLDEHHFILPDRGNLKLSTYFIGKSNGQWQVALLNTIKTPSPIHQIFPSKGNYQGDKNVFYASAEGLTKQGAENAFPSILELKLVQDKGLVLTRSLSLNVGAPVEKMGLHHGDFHPFEKLVYVGSKEGTIFVIDYENMSIHSTIQAGKGIGHVKMIKSKKLAVGINHEDVFVTVIDLTTNTKIKDVPVSDKIDLVGKANIQAHPKYFVKGDKFYSFVTEDGVFYEMDLNDLEVTRVLEVGGKPSQGSFVTMTVEE